uniref:Coiled-coil domain-containing protein 93 n=1 Tax=Caligus rogercresseyi TaxID=217165 RepID=C1BQT6_CALRO|nr:Coiled-coil domain-containing protein 93 [Caligus rogercresseyi]
MERHSMDEETFLLYEEILCLLIEAGYYRAQIKGLSPFDQIVGGITWCLQMIFRETGGNHALEEDLIFSEDASIGAQVLLTEKLVRGLLLLGCPHEIDPHQLITGEMDFPHILPVIRWLVQRGIDARRNLIKNNRKVALKMFYEQYGFLYPDKCFFDSNALNTPDDRSNYQPSSPRNFDNDNIQKLAQEIEDADREISLLEDNLAALRSKVAEVEVKHTERQTTLASLQDEERTLLPEGSDEKILRLSLMIEKSENFKKKEKDFKNSCTEIINDIVAKNVSLRKDIECIEGSSAETSSIQMATLELNDLKGKLALVLMELLKINKVIEEAPSKYELSQYHKRFLELEELSESKELQSRKLIISCRIHKELKAFIKNQIHNLDHLSETLPFDHEVSVSQFMDQMESLSDEMKTLKAHVDERLALETSKRSSASKELDKLNDYYRVYNLLAKDLQELVSKRKRERT